MDVRSSSITKSLDVIKYIATSYGTSFVNTLSYMLFLRKTEERFSDRVIHVDVT